MNDRLLSDAYYNPGGKASYGGVKRLIDSAGHLPKKDVVDWLAGQDSYTLHKPIRRTYRRQKTIVSSIDSQWQADLSDMVKIARHNDDNKYMLVVIDVLSKYLWVTPIKSKSGKDLTESFSSILSELRSLARGRLF